MNPTTSSLVAAAVAGLFLGATGCSKSDVPAPAPNATPAAAVSAVGTPPVTTAVATASAVPEKQSCSGAPGKHACKGMNDCKGMGGCKTEKHGCKGMNACKGQGGCSA